MPTRRQGNAEYSLPDPDDPYGDPLGEEFPGYMQYKPRPLPPPPEADLARDFDDPRVSAEVAAELMRRWKATPKGTAARKRGIVEHVDPETGQVTRYDRYGKLAKQGFDPNRTKGKFVNFLRYMSQRPEDKQAVLAAGQREKADTQLDYENRLRTQRFEEASRAGSVSDYNEWMEREETRADRERRAAATEAYRMESLRLRGEPRPMHPAQEEYLGAQTERSRAEADYARGGKAAGFKTGRPTGGLNENQLRDRMYDLEQAIEEYRSGGEQAEGLEQSYLWGAIGGPSSMRSPVVGDKAPNEAGEMVQRRIRFGEKDEAISGFTQGLSQSERELADLEAQYDRYYGQGRGTGGAPPPGAGSSSEEAMKAQSWLEKTTDPIQMPGAGEWGNLSPEDQAVFAELQRLEEEGWNVDAPSVQERAMRLVQERMAGQQDADAGRVREPLQPAEGYGRTQRWPTP